jgi:tRNA threonylcarbamoyladenosine biosynthesis protein TsaB
MASARRRSMPLSTVLAIDTATEVCSVALLQGDRLIERCEAVGQKHSERVLPMVDMVLADAGIQLSGVDLFAFGAGPGSFTGLRIACGVVQGLAYGCGRPVVGVGNLRALAAAGFASRAAGTRLLAAIDARMSEAYCAVYRNHDDVTELRAPALELPSALAGIASASDADLIAGDALGAFPDVWQGAGTAERLPEVRATAGTIARLARIDFDAGRAVPAAEAMPHYVRDRVALTIDERRQKVIQ